MQYSDNVIYKNEFIKIEIEENEVPWLKIFTIKDIKEFSQCNRDTKNEIWRCLDICEKEMLSYFQPDKINNQDRCCHCQAPPAMARHCR